MQRNLAPIALFVYNRPDHTQQTLEALKNNTLAEESILYVFADGPKENATEEELERIRQVKNVINKENWCKQVILVESQKNKGLASSIINGVSEIVTKYGKIIVLEDDLITAKGFLQYMNDALDKYKFNKNVMQISGHCFPASKIKKKHSSFFIPIATSWGWGTWDRAWSKFRVDANGYEILKEDKSIKRKFDLDDSYPFTAMLLNQMEERSIDSWAIRWWWSIFIENGISLFPDKSLINNIGFGKEATHTTSTNPFKIDDFDERYLIKHFPSEIKINDNFFIAIKKNIKKSINNNNESKLKFIIKYLVRGFKKDKIKNNS